MRFAYADPPYLGCCGLYDHHHPDGRCWDDLSTHMALVERLSREFPDGWALSCTSRLSPGAAAVLPGGRAGGTVAQDIRRVQAWRPTRVHVGAGDLLAPGRNPNAGHSHPPPEKNGKQTTPKDFAIIDAGSALAEPITLKKGLTGAKPEAFCEWVLDLLNVLPGDEVVDLFPGTGIMGRVAASRAEQLTLEPAA